MAPRRRSPSEDFSSSSPPPRERLRPTWFDVTPEMLAQGLAGRSEDEVKRIILESAGTSGAPEQGGGQLTQATRHARRVYVGGLPPSANEDRISGFFSDALAAVGGAPSLLFSSTVHRCVHAIAHHGGAPRHFPCVIQVQQIAMQRACQVVDDDHHF